MRDTIRTDIPTSSTVSDVLIWNVEQSGNDEYEVLYEVVQSIKEATKQEVCVLPI